MSFMVFHPAYSLSLVLRLSEDTSSVISVVPDIIGDVSEITNGPKHLRTRCGVSVIVQPCLAMAKHPLIPLARARLRVCALSAITLCVGPAHRLYPMCMAVSYNNAALCRISRLRAFSRLPIERERESLVFRLNCLVCYCCLLFYNMHLQVDR